ncbi:MAG TPA: isoleucine--tRNA ligase [Acidimicrobiales bacterium]|nr:isoleucine--tRNA ligase [Acidimicrobiales bacterium]
MFTPVPPDTDFVALEQSELARWAAHRVFERSIEQRKGATPWVFYEGPPTANGLPGLHHVWARVYKDLFCRFRTMAGAYVARRAGWDTHGLPVEVEVEKRLGITSKQQIEEQVGIAEFTRLCRESVYSYVDEFARLTNRIGYWLNMDAAYWTLSPDYIQSVWWHLKTLFDQDLLYEDLKVVPYCPRCGTALSSHELGQPGVYHDEEDESAYVRLPIRDPDPAVVGDARWLAVWTTTPWTLLSNTGVAVNPELTYAVVDGLVMAEELVDAMLGEGASARISRRVTGRELVGFHYDRPFDDLVPPPGSDGWRVVAADYVTTEEGTGLVHLAPAFGEVDRQIGRENGLPSLNPVGPDGHFTDEISWLAGHEVRSANSMINDRLESSGLLVRRLPYVHSYPHCWRCQTPLIYWGKPSWYIATSTRKDDLLAANETIDWHPAHIKEGRFGEWLSNNVDWALSRDRYWGTPLPIWRCGLGHLHCVGSLTELSELCGRDVTGIDPHRPAIDEIVFPCPECADAGLTEGDAIARRVQPVIDAWFDSGSMPAAQVGYPHAPGSTESFDFPADFISEAIDQTRGWFYSLLAVNTLVFGQSPYRHVVCLGHIIDMDGRKMSKSLGNIIDPWTILDTRGADAMRWWMFSQGSPWTPTRASLAAIDTAMRDMLLTLWNTFSFFTTYASLNDFDPTAAAIPAVADRGALDRWILSRLASTVSTVTVSLEAYEPLDAATALGSLVDDLSNWYVRLSRRRFWRTDPDAAPGDTLAAQATLHEVLTTVSLLLAPFCPFMADAMWRALSGVADAAGDGAAAGEEDVAAGTGDSVHLADWPSRMDERVDASLEAQMALARRLTSLGRAARSEAGVKVRQPLARALVFLSSDSPAILHDLVAAELNVDAIDVAHELSEVLEFELVPNFRTLGPRLGERVQHLKPALAALDGVEAAATLEAGRSLSLDLPGGPAIELTPDDVQLRVRGQQGFAVSREGGEVVALDLTLSDSLRRRGLAREVVRLVQDLRKTSGLHVSDRIHLRLEGLDTISELFDYIAREVLAVSIGSGLGDGETGVALDLETDEGPVAALAWLEKASAGE